MSGSSKTVVVFVKTEVMLPEIPSWFRTTDGKNLEVTELDNDVVELIGRAWTDALKGKANSNAEEDVSF